MAKNYLSLRRAAARLGIHHATLSRAVKRGEIAPEFVTPGGVMRFAESDVERFQRQRLNYKNRNSDDAPPNTLKDTGAFGPEGLSRVDELLHSIPDTARDLVGAQYAALAVMSDSGELVGFITSGLTEEQRDAIGSPPKGKGMLGLIQELSVSVRSADLTKHPGSSGFPPNHPPMASFLGVPVMLNGENIGNLYLTNKIDADEFSDRDQEIVETFARYAATAIENATLYVREASLRQEAEEGRARVRAMIQSSAAGVIVADAADGSVILANDEASRILGLALAPGTARRQYERAVVYRKPDGSVFDPRQLPLQLALDKGVTSRGVEVAVDHPDGRSIPTVVNAAPVSDEHGNITAAIAVFDDITALQEVERVKAEFLSMVTHDLKGPLATIKGMSSGLLMEQGPRDIETILEYLNSIDEEADRMSELVGNLLDMSRIQANSMPLDPEICHLADITSETVRQIERSRVGGQHEIVVDVPLELPEIYVDFDQISRVLSNLLSNAIKYSPPGSRITIRSYMDPADTGMIITEVSDRGIGIPEDEIGKIFDRFYRVTSQRGRGSPGSGLGLTICKNIIEAHDGNTWVESTAGEGSKFYFSLTASVASV